MQDEVIRSFLSAPRLKKLTSSSVCCLFLAKPYITGVWWEQLCSGQSLLKIKTGIVIAVAIGGGFFGAKSSKHS